MFSSQFWVPCWYREVMRVAWFSRESFELENQTLGTVAFWVGWSYRKDLFYLEVKQLYKIIVVLD